MDEDGAARAPRDRQLEREVAAGVPTAPPDRPGLTAPPNLIKEGTIRGILNP